MSKRTLLLSTFFVLAGLILAACGGGAAGYTCEDAVGCVDIEPGDPVKLASLQAISGPVINLGDDQNRGTEIAIDDRGGELLGHPISFQKEDDLCSAEGGTTGSQKILSDPQVVAVIGTSCSGAGVPSSENFSEASVLMVSGSNTSPSLTATGYFSAAGPAKASAWSDGYFRTAHNDEFQGRAAARFAIDTLGVTKAATVHDGDPYTEGLANAFGGSFREFGGDVVIATAVNKGDTDMRPLLTSIAAAEAEVIFFPIFEPEANFIVLQSVEFEELEDTLLFAADGVLSATFFDNVAEDGLGMYFSGPGQPSSAAYSALSNKYEEKYGEGFTQAFHARAYDATNMILDTIESVAVQDDDGTLHIGRRALIDAFYAIAAFDGLTGSLTCNQFGDCANPVISIYRFDDVAAGVAGVTANILFTSGE